MSLSNLPWSHFGPYRPFPEKQKFNNYYQDALSSSGLLPLGLSISAAFAHDSDISHPVNMNTFSVDQMERFQQLSNEYEPEVQGPLVSTKQSSHVIAMEYANGDPTLATKANALTGTHPMARFMKGDGNCGWRAVAFGYFETLFARRDSVHVQHELSRIKSLNSLLDQVGQEEHLYEMFVDATEEAFQKTIAAIQNGDPDETFLVNAFNDEFRSSAIVTHFRLLTSAWMRLNPQRYQGYLTVPLDTYCTTQIEPVKTEIDEPGLRALVDGVIERAGFGVELLYLDRSKGDAATQHQLTPSPRDGATIRLLYRPGHYDILYRPEQTVNMAPMVNYRYGMTSNYFAWDQGALSFDVDPLSMSIPGLMADPAFAMGSTSPMSSVPPTPASPYPISSPQDMYQSPMQSRASVPSITAASPTPPMPRAAPPLPMGSLPPRSKDGPQIRFNELAYMSLSESHSLPITTPFRNSPHNPAHFQNQDFEPIHWEPSGPRR